MAYRYFLLCAHYRAEIKFSFKALQEAEKTYSGLLEKVQEWKVATEGAAVEFDEQDTTVQQYLTAFWAAMSHDLRTPAAIQVLWKVVREKHLSDRQKLALLLTFDPVLGLGLQDAGRGTLTPEESVLITARETARAQKNWAESDKLRDELLAVGIQVKDTPEGTVWSRLK